MPDNLSRYNNSNNSYNFLQKLYFFSTTQHNHKNKLSSSIQNKIKLYSLKTDKIKIIEDKEAAKGQLTYTR